MYNQKKAGIIVVALASMLAASVHAADFTWIGDAVDWNNAANWTPEGGPPTQTDNVFWNSVSGVNNAMVNASSFTMNNFTLDGGSVFTQIGTSEGPLTFNVNGNMTHTGTGSSVLFRGTTAPNTTETLAVNIAGNLSTSGGQPIDFGQHRTDTRYNYALAGLTVGGKTTIGSGGQIRMFTNGALAQFGEVEFATTGSNMRLLLSEGSFTSDFGQQFPSGRTVEIAGLSGGIDSAASRVAVSSSSAVEGGAVTLKLTGSGTYNYAGQIVNRADGTVGVSSITIDKTGTGVQILSGTGVWGGTTTVRAGGLIIDGTHTARGNGYTIKDGAWLGGDGLITLAGADLGDATMLFEEGSKFVFDAAKTLTVNNSAFNTWTVDLTHLTPESLVNQDGTAVDWASVADNTYTLMDGTATFSNINTNWVNDIAGSGKDVRFVEGSLQLEVKTPTSGPTAEPDISSIGVSLQNGDAVVTIAFNDEEKDQGVQYALWFSTNLVAGSGWVPVVSNATTSPLVYTNDAPAGFFRVEAK